jgi:Rrf2 family protein
MASAVHILSFMAFVGPETTNAEAIARSLKTHPVVVRRLLKSLENEGLVRLRRGRNGGVGLARATSDIDLGQIYRAVENDGGVFALRGEVNPDCPVAVGMEAYLPPLFEDAKAAVETTLGRTSLAQLMAAIG